jgi:hypothetical protein
LRKKVTGKRPHRCSECDWRGWAPDLGVRFSRAESEASSLAIAPDPRNLKETALAREKRRRQDADLGKLDEVIQRRQEPAPHM